MIAVVSGEMDEKLPQEVTEHVLYDEYEYEETDPLTGEYLSRRVD